MSTEYRYNIRLHTYSGMVTTLWEKVDRNFALAYIRSSNRRARFRGQPVSYLGDGRWEHETPEDAFMIGDGDGILQVTKCRV